MTTSGPTWQRRRSPLATRVCAVAAALLTVACGSTAQQTGAAGGPAGLSGPAGGPTAAQDPSGLGPVAAGGPVAPSTTTTGARGPAGNPSAAGAPLPGTSGPAGPSAPGQAARPGALAPVKIGIGVTIGYADAIGGLGVEGASTGDNRAQAGAVIAHLNANGGLGGRRIEPVYFDYNVQQDPAVSDQEACTAWTEDTRVFAAMSLYGKPVTLGVCLAKQGVASLLDFREPPDDDLLRAYPSAIFAPSQLSLSRRTRLYVKGLADLGYFTATDKIGLVLQDETVYRNVSERVLKPELRARGLTVAAEVAITGTNDFANAVLRFRQEDVTRVLFLDQEGGLAYFFMTAAESQAYRPRYGLSTASYPSFLELNVPPAQLSGSVGVGWMPTKDVAQNPTPTDASVARCDAILRKAGQEPADRVAEGVGHAFCDWLFFLDRALELAPTLSLAGLQQGVEAIGTSFDPALTFSSRLGPGRHDGASSYRNLAFDDGCRCFRYTSPPRSTG